MTCWIYDNFLHSSPFLYLKKWYCRCGEPELKKLKAMFIACTSWVLILSENLGIFLTLLPMQSLKLCKKTTNPRSIVQLDTNLRVILVILWIINSGNGIIYRPLILLHLNASKLIGFIIELKIYSSRVLFLLKRTPYNWKHHFRLASTCSVLCLNIIIIYIATFFSATGMKMHLTDSLMRSILLLHMTGGKGLCIVYFQFLHILVPGPGNSGGREVKFIAFRNM